MRRGNVSRLLRQVQGRPYATAADHEESEHREASSAAAAAAAAASPQLATKDSVGQRATSKPAEDINRDPDSESDSDSSNGDDKANVKGFHDIPAAKRNIRAPRKSSAVKSGNVNIHGRVGATDISSSTLNEASSVGGGGQEGMESEAEKTVFSQSSSSSQKRKKAVYGKALKKPKMDHVEKGNAIAPEKSKVAFRRPLGQKESGEDPGSRETPRLQLAAPSSDNDRSRASFMVGPTFRRPLGAGSVSVPASTGTSAVSEDAEPPLSSARDSSPLSSLSSPDAEVLELGPILTSDAYVASTPCPICGEGVDESFKRDFEAEKCGSRRMNFRLQELFCKAHKERTAKKTWQDREYPQIDWDSLHERLEKHNQRIRDVLYGHSRSRYLDELEQRLRSRKANTTIQTVTNDEDSAPQVGYYGSRGEKIMTNHILTVFGAELRQRAGTDKVMSAMGVSGGVSGYTQSVLVPEMALALVMEDTGCGAEEARRVVAESSEIGDIVNEAAEEHVPDDYRRGGDEEGM